MKTKRFFKIATTAAITSALTACNPHEVLFCSEKDSTAKTSASETTYISKLDETPDPVHSGVRQVHPAQNKEVQKSPGKEDGRNSSFDTGFLNTVSTKPASEESDDARKRCIDSRGTWDETAERCSFPAPSFSAFPAAAEESEKDREPVLTPYQKELSRLNAEIRKASAEYVTARSNYEKALEAYREAQEILSGLTGTLITDLNAVEQAKAYAGQKEAALVIAQQTLEEAQTQYSEAIAESSKEYVLAEAAAKSICDEKTAEAEDELRSALDRSKDIYDEKIAEADTVYTNAVKEAEAGRIASDKVSEEKYLQAMDKASEKYNRDVSAAKEIQEEENRKARETYTKNLQDAVEAYNNAVKEAKNDPDYLLAKEELDRAVTAQKKAVEARENADNALAEAQDDLTEAEEEKRLADVEVTRAEEARNEADEALSKAMKELESAREICAQAYKNDEDAKEAVKEAEKKVEQYEKEKDNAEHNLAEANKAYENAAQRISDADREVKKAQAEADAAQAAVDAGIKGFLEYRASQGDDVSFALTILDYGMTSDNIPDAQKTNMGETGDTTSLENVLAALDYIDECNDLAEGYGRLPYYVSDRAMALAEVNTNISSIGKLSHTRLTPWARAENLAKGNWYGDAYSDHSPFRDWFDAEKAIDDEVRSNGGVPNSGDVGHFNNIVGNTGNIGDMVTGFAISKDGTPTYGQVFSKAQDGEEYYTVEEYRDRFLAYYNSVMDAVNNAKAELEKKTEAYAALVARNGLTPEEQKEIEDAKFEVANAAAVLDGARTILADANILSEETAIALENAINNAEEKKGEADSKQSEAEEADHDLRNAQDNAEAALDSVIASQVIVENRAAESENAETVLKEADNAVEIAETALSGEEARIAKNLTDQKKKVTDAEEDTIIEDTEKEQQKIFDEITAEARTERTEAENIAKENLQAEKDASLKKYEEIAKDAESVHKTACDDAENEKKLADESAQTTHDESILEAEREYETSIDAAEEIKSVKDAEAEKKLEAVKSETDTAETEYKAAAESEQKVRVTAENTEKREEELKQAEEKLTDKEKEKEQFLHPNNAKDDSETVNTVSFQTGSASYKVSVSEGLVYSGSKNGKLSPSANSVTIMS